MDKFNFKQINSLFAALPEDEYQRLDPYLTLIDLPLGKILYEPEELIETVYFPISALISIVHILENGMITEIGLIGNGGAIGLPVILGSLRSANSIIVQIAGTAIQIPAEILKQEFDRQGKLQKLLLLHIEARLIQVSQQAVCNRHHSIEQRLARWLLTVADLIASDELSLTQEFISNMLGVRRSSVTVAAGNLQKAGMIRYSRANIVIVDRLALENITCECYDYLKGQYRRLLDNNYL